jgi:hypothetical protein
VPHLIWSRLLTIKVVALSKSSTAVRVDAEDAWSFRLPAEAVPRGVRTVTISRRRFGHSPLAERITQPSEVRTLVHWVDGLPAFAPPDGAGACSWGSAGGFPTTVAFRRGDGTVLASAQIGSRAVCDPITFSVRGRLQTPLKFAPLSLLG